MATLRRDSYVAKIARAIYHRMIEEPVVEPPPQPSGTSQLESLQSLEQLIPGLYSRQVILQPLQFRWGDLWNDNSLILYCCLAASGFTPIVEFGTYRGRTAFNLALNTRDKITTIDIGPRIGRAIDAASNIECHEYPEYTPGEAFRNAFPKDCDRINLLIGNSMDLDLCSLYRTAGLVIVDGGHSYKVCKSDSEKALKLVRPGGIVVWDDYGDYWPGVKQAVDEIGMSLKLYWLVREGTVVHIAA